MTFPTGTPITRSSLRDSDIVIAFMGPTGSGKSNMIDCLASSQPPQASPSACLEPHTKNVNAVRILGHEKHGDRIVLVDTPGFDDDDLQVIYTIKEWLQQGAKIKLTGIAYLHQITEKRMTSPPEQNLGKIGQLASATRGKSVGQIVLVTTMWDKGFDRLAKERRRDTIQEVYWTSMQKEGAGCREFDNRQETAWSIINDLIEKDGVVDLTPMVEAEQTREERRKRAGFKLAVWIKLLFRKRHAVE